MDREAHPLLTNDFKSISDKCVAVRTDDEGAAVKRQQCVIIPEVQYLHSPLISSPSPSTPLDDLSDDNEVEEIVEILSLDVEEEPVVGRSLSFSHACRVCVCGFCVCVIDKILKNNANNLVPNTEQAVKTKPKQEVFFSLSIFHRF